MTTIIDRDIKPENLPHVRLLLRVGTLYLRVVDWGPAAAFVWVLPDGQEREPFVGQG